MKNSLIKIINAALPPHTRRRKAVVRVVTFRRQKISPNRTTITYASWIRDCEPKLFGHTASMLQKCNKRPVISVVVPCYNTPDKYLIPLLESVKGQLYESWQLVLIDGSDKPEFQDSIRRQAATDKRIVYERVGKNLGIVGNTNIGLKLAKGEYVAFMDHDDVLSPHALAENILVINNHSHADLIYSDEDKLSDDGKVRQIPFFKPDWSPETLLGVNYITHFVVAKRKLVMAIGGLRPGFDGAQDYDFLLRLTEKTQYIHHIPKLLYHWRLAEGSTAKTVGEKNYADTAGQRALRDAVKRRGIKADVVEIPDRPTNYRLRYKLPAKQPLVSIIIPFKDKVEYLKMLVPTILASSYKNYEIILISNNSTEPETHAYLDTLRGNKRCKIHIWDHKYNFAAINNFGRTKARGEYLVCLNNDTKVHDTFWLEELIGAASQPEIGAVGPLLLYSDGRIQHAGIILGMNTMAGHAFRLRQPEEWTDFGLALWPRNYLAVTGACLAVKASKFDKVGGFDEKLTIGGNDVALCLSLYKIGYRTLYWPFTRLTHYENVSVGDYNSSVPIGDYNRSLLYYTPYLNYHDPYFNQNLDLMNEQIGLRSSYEQE